MNGAQIIPFKARAEVKSLVEARCPHGRLWSMAACCRRWEEIIPPEDLNPLIVPRWCFPLLLALSLSFWAAIIWVIVR